MSGQQKRNILIGLVLLLGLIAFVFLRTLPPGGNGPEVTEGQELSAEELLQVVELRNVGLAELENNQWQTATGKFKELQQILPESRLALLNLSIAEASHYVGLDPNTPVEELSAAREAALNTIQQLRSLTPDDAISYRLESKIVEKDGNPDLAVQLLQQAVERRPDDPSLWYDLSRISQTSREPTTIAAGKEALKKLHELAPENVFAFLQWMNSEIQEEDADFEKITAELEALLTPLAKGIEKRNRYNVLTFIDRIKESLKQGNSETARRMFAPVKNIVTGDDVSRSDRDRLDLNLLAFVEFDFEPAVQEQIEALESQVASSAAKIRLEPLSAQPTISQNVQGLAFVDLNLNTQTSLLVLTQGKLNEISWVGENAEPQVLEHELSITGDHFLFADLDYDLKEQPANAENEFQAQHTADLDLICYGSKGIEIFENTLAEIGGDVQFSKVTLNGELAELSNVERVIPADLNNDGDLDLAVVSDGKLSCWSNTGSFEFIPFELPTSPASKIVDLVALDFDRDIDIDLFTLMEDGSLYLLDSYRHGTFRWQDLNQKYGGAKPALLRISDADHNGSWDLFIAGEGGAELFLTQMPTSGQVLFKTQRQITDAPVDSLQVLDIDHDGRSDLILGGTDGVALWQGEGTGTFREVEKAVDEIAGAQSVAAGDISQEGTYELGIISDQKLHLLTTTGDNQNGWIDVALLAARVEDKGGAGSQRINHYGYGSLIEVRTGTRFQQAFVDSPVTRFGLGDSSEADAVRIIWTNGIPQNIVKPEASQQVWEVQKLLGSCPYLYAWNGEAFEFVTDLLWAAPIGLQNSQGQLVPDRPWEYIKIAADQLQPKDGKYVLQITEELWEVAYFDQIELIAIDHPADIAIYSNEKVGPASIAEVKIHQVRDKKSPVSVLNHLGDDLLDDVKEEDGVYARPFTKRITQGYTDESYLEIDLGLKEKPEQLTLYLTGWIRPTDTGLNVAFSESASVPGPAPPSIWVPDESGQFIEVIPFCGFPGGKTKTIAIDLSDAFLTDDYRLRLATSQELYWDQIFYSTEAISAEPEHHKLECLSADLHHRGVSAIEYGTNNGPERFLYDQVIKTPAWPVIAGKFTRFGDVRELVTTTDDQLLVLGTGDEVTIEFAVPEGPLPQAWKRDFFLRSVGWDKDANLHTVTGQTVEPLPSVEMSSYPNFDYPRSPEWFRYLKEYQTRELNPEAFRDVLQRSTLPELEVTEPILPE